MNKERIRKIKILSIFTLFLISFLLYFPPLYEKVLEGNSSANTTNITINFPGGFFDKPSALDTLKKITSPFDLKYYNLYLDFSLKSDNKNLPVYPKNITYNFNGETNVIIVGEKNFISTLKIEEPYVLQLSNITYIPNSNYHQDGPSIRLYNITAGSEMTYVITAEMNPWDALGNMILFFLFWIGVIILIQSFLDWIGNKKS